jgi:hypothetical protein
VHICAIWDSRRASSQATWCSSLRTSRPWTAERPEADFTDLHAWAEAYLPGAGWIGLDATSGLLAGEGHIPLACTAVPASAAAVYGFADPSGVQFEFEMRIDHRGPRVTKPYTSSSEIERLQRRGRAESGDAAGGETDLCLRRRYDGPRNFVLLKKNAASPACCCRR